MEGSEKALVDALDAEIQAGKEKADELVKELQDVQRDVRRAARAKAALTGETIGATHVTKLPSASDDRVYPPNEETQRPIIDLIEKEGETDSLRVFEAGLAASRERANDYLNRMARFGILKRDGTRAIPGGPGSGTPGSGRPYQIYKLS